MQFKNLSRWLAGTALAASALAAQATSFSDIVIFGDSLSDTGNLALATGNGFPAPYYQNRASDGLIWTDYFTAALGDTALPALAGGSNYAFSGARTGTDSTPPGVLAQVVGMWGASHAAADPNALYVVVGGGNDMRDARSAAGGTSAGHADVRQAYAENAYSNLEKSVGYLIQKGARNILISNLPDLGLTPEAVFLGAAAASSDAAKRFNSLLPNLVNYGQGFGVNMSFLDMAGVAGAVYADALTGGSKYGLTNVMAPCNGFQGSPNVAATACDRSLFSDALHPSSAAHRLIAQAAVQAVSAVPEPQTYALMLFGLAAVGAWARRQRR